MIKWRAVENLAEPGKIYGFNTNLEDDPLKLPYVWRVLDDDGEVYVIGRSDDNESQQVFRILDYHTAVYGATELQFWNTKTREWETI